MVTPVAGAAIAVYLAIKYGVVVAPYGRPAARRIALVLPQILCAIALVLSEGQAWYEVTILCISLLPVAGPRISPAVIGVYAVALAAARAGHQGDIAVAICSAAAALLSAGFIAFDRKLR